MKEMKSGWKSSQKYQREFKTEYCSEEIDIPYEYIDYVIYNYNHRAIPAETLERALAYCHLSREDISDRLVDSCDEENDADLDDMIGGLPD